MNKSEQEVAARLKEEGYSVLNKGYPDLLAYRDDEIKMVEVKRGKDKVKPHQRECHEVLRKAGINVEVIRDGKIESSSIQALVGKFFHSYPEGKIQWQGQVLKELNKEKYLVQLFEWLLGEPSDQIIISLDQMISENWKFYNTSEEWRVTYAREQKWTPNDIEAQERYIKLRNTIE